MPRPTFPLAARGGLLRGLAAVNVSTMVVAALAATILTLGAGPANAGCGPGEWGPSCLPCPGGSATPCNSNGTCDEGPSGDGTCACDPDWYGTACETFCSADFTCNGGGICDSAGACVCNVGVIGAFCDTCAPDYYNWPTCTYCDGATTCSGAGACSAAGNCICEDGVIGTACDQCATDRYGWPSCTYCTRGATCNGAGDCSLDGGGACDCDTGYAGAACETCDTGYEGWPFCQPVVPEGCPATPSVGCIQSSKSKLLVKDLADDTKDLLVWVSAKGEAFNQSATSDPALTTTYRLCVYDTVAAVPSLAIDLEVAPGPLWMNKDPNGWKYKDPAGTSDGATVVLLKAGAADKTKVMLKAQGAGVPLPAMVGTKYFSLDSTVTVQLINEENGFCWATGYTTSKKNDASGFKAVAP